MEITAYVLGMLTIIATIMVTMIVVGVVRIIKLEKRTKQLQHELDHTRHEIYQYINDGVRSIWDQFETAGRDVTMVEKTIMNQIDQTRQQMDRAIDETHRSMSDISASDRRYIDSRIDKLIDTYFDHVGAKTPPKNNKEFING